MGVKCYCGHDCAKCVTYLATKNDDNCLKTQAQSFYKAEFGMEIPLDKMSCHGGRTDEIFELCRDCPFSKCCRERNISACNKCPEYPCGMLEKYQQKYVNKCNQI